MGVIAWQEGVAALLLTLVVVVALLIVQARHPSLDRWFSVATGAALLIGLAVGIHLVRWTPSAPDDLTFGRSIYNGGEGLDVEDAPPSCGAPSPQGQPIGYVDHVYESSYRWVGTVTPTGNGLAAYWGGGNWRRDGTLRRDLILRVSADCFVHYG